VAGQTFFNVNILFGNELPFTSNISTVQLSTKVSEGLSVVVVVLVVVVLVEVPVVVVGVV
jgi:hypothetical protein